MRRRDAGLPDGMGTVIQPDRENHHAALTLLHQHLGLPTPANDYDDLMTRGYPPLSLDYIERILARARQQPTGDDARSTEAQVADEDVDMVL